ncbi:MAG: hypothetical protein V4488_26390 [Pseudomonadota bacterium]
MERKYYFETGNWDEAAWLLAKHDPDRFQDEKNAKKLLKNSVIEELARRPLAELQRFEPIVYGPVMVLTSAFLQSSREVEYESVHVHFWHRLATQDHTTVEVHSQQLADIGELRSGAQAVEAPANDARSVQAG